MRGWLIASLGLLAGCDQIRGKNLESNPEICTGLAAQSLVEMWGRGETVDNPDIAENPYATASAYSKALTDCLIVHARQFANQSDVSSVIARAVSASCQTESSNYVQSYLDSRNLNILHAATPQDLPVISAEIDTIKPKLIKSVGDVALRYVVEARAGHCAIKRHKLTEGFDAPAMPDIVD
jgi:hypothetical protein